jgi:hypothetical protein
MAVVTRRQQFLVGHASAAPGCSAVFLDGAYCNASKATPLMSTVSPIPPERALIHHDGREHAGRAERRFLRSAHPFAGEHVHGCRKLSPAQTEQCWQGPATVDAFDERRLARARWTAHHDDFALGDFRRAMLQHLKIGVPFTDFAERDLSG